MKSQIYIISALLFALIVAVFAVINVDAVEVNYLFTTTESPLILVILTSTLLGGLITGAFSIYHFHSVHKKMRGLEAENEKLRTNLVLDKDPDVEIGTIELVDEKDMIDTK